MSENFLSYLVVFLIIIIVIAGYLLLHKRKSSITKRKISKAIEYGFHEPVSLHPVIDTETCIGSGACIAACPEQDILGMVHGQAKVINASRCVGHGACFHACPVEAISLCIGTEKRGVDLPHVDVSFQTNVPGIYIAGELGGMGLIKNAVEQGKQAIENIRKNLSAGNDADYDVVIIGAGPAGIAASLSCAKHNLKYVTLEQDSLGGTVYNFPRQKIVMTSPVELPLHGMVKLNETTKVKLLELWQGVISKNNIVIHEQEKAEVIEKQDGIFRVITTRGAYRTRSVLLAIGRRGSPRKLGVPGELKEKVSYRLLEPELIVNREVLVVGGGDSAVESALLLADENNVTLCYRGNAFSRLKPANLEKLNNAVYERRFNVLLNCNVKEIFDDKVILTIPDSELYELKNDLVYIFAGGELPAVFLEKAGIKITTRFGETVLSHKKNI